MRENRQLTLLYGSDCWKTELRDKNKIQSVLMNDQCDQLKDALDWTML